MNRVTKFRVWDKESKGWYVPTYKAYQGDLEYLVVNLDGSLNMITLTERIHESAFPGRFDLVQFTGLHDNYDNELFQGDIVEVHRHNLERYVVRFIDGSSVFASRYEGMCTYNCISVFLEEDYEIIKLGNIYENPKLLEGAANE